METWNTFVDPEDLKAIIAAVMILVVLWQVFWLPAGERTPRQNQVNQFDED